MADALVGWAYSSLLLSLRVAPVFALAPPFSLIKMPVPFRVLFSLGIAACMVGANPEAARIVDYGAGNLLVTAISELVLGSIFLLAFQLTFAALQFAGRTVDVQAGFGLALLIDPTTRAQMPLVGTLFAYAAAAVFFAADGHVELLHLFAASLDAIPLGGHHFPTSIGPLAGFLSITFLTAFGVAGAAILTLFLADLVIALLSRTVPQMNVLVLGFQVKTLLLLAVLPVTFGVGGSLLARTTRLTLEALPALI